MNITQLEDEYLEEKNAMMRDWKNFYTINSKGLER